MLTTSAFIDIEDYVHGHRWLNILEVEEGLYRKMLIKSTFSYMERFRVEVGLYHKILTVEVGLYHTILTQSVSANMEVWTSVVVGRSWTESQSTD